MPQPHEPMPRRSRPEVPVMLRRFLLTVLPLAAALHAYIGWRILPALPIGVAGMLAGVAFLAVSTLLIPMTMLARFLVRREALADGIGWAGAFFMGLFSSLFVLTLLRDLVLAAVGSPSLAASSALAVIFAALVLTVVGFFNARRLAGVTQVDIPIPDLPAALTGFSLVQLSDMHIGPTIKRGYVRAIVDRVNALDADLVVITGDMVDGSVAQLASHTAPLADLRARHGVIVVTGNHEYYSGADAWMAEYRRLGLRGLMNEHVVIDHDGARLVVAGVTDYNAGAFNPAQRSDPAAALAGSPEGVPRILLAHQPRSSFAAEPAGFDLQLSGHTHGGQFWPWNLFVRLQQPFTAGLHRVGRLWVYTSRGTGYWGPPKRLCAPSEISLLHLVPEERGASPAETSGARRAVWKLS